MTYQPTREEWTKMLDDRRDNRTRAIEGIITKAEAAALAPAPQPSELAAVREEIRLVSEILRAFLGYVTDGESEAECKKQRGRFLALLARERELMAAEPAPAVPTADALLAEKQAGIYRKFRVERTDGSSGPGGKHERCEFFVLDWEHDKFAVPAALAYADACEQEFPELARDLRATAN